MNNKLILISFLLISTSIFCAEKKESKEIANAEEKKVNEEFLQKNITLKNALNRSIDLKIKNHNCAFIECNSINRMSPKGVETHVYQSDEPSFEVIYKLKPLDKVEIIFSKENDKIGVIFDLMLIEDLVDEIEREVISEDEVSNVSTGSNDTISVHNEIETFILNSKIDKINKGSEYYFVSNKEHRPILITQSQYINNRY